jgi:hypothetical protein
LSYSHRHADYTTAVHGLSETHYNAQGKPC